jgi:RHS repeat-associated protein
LRFPGQYFDAETGLHYNYYRDFDPAIGRYVESDPIGLTGGIDTYTYARSNPLNYSDRFGLVPNPLELTCVDPFQPVCWVGGLLDILSTAALPAAAGAATVAAAATSGDSTVQMAAPGNQVDSQIARDYGEAASAARLCGGEPPDRCEWLRQNASKYRPDQVKATEKAWGCRRSRASR